MIFKNKHNFKSFKKLKSDLRNIKHSNCDIESKEIKVTKVKNWQETKKR